MHVFDRKNLISIFGIPYFPVLPFKTAERIESRLNRCQKLPRHEPNLISVGGPCRPLGDQALNQPRTQLHPENVFVVQIDVVPNRPSPSHHCISHWEPHFSPLLHCLLTHETRSLDADKLSVLGSILVRGQWTLSTEILVPAKFKQSCKNVFEIRRGPLLMFCFFRLTGDVFEK